MKNIAKSLVLAGAVAAAGTAFADFGDINPYIGADYLQSSMKLKSPYSDLLKTKKSFPGARLFVGTKFHENFGVEAGYEISKRKTNDFKIVAGTKVGTFGPTNNDINGKATLRRSGPFFDLVGFLPVADCFELLGSIGLGWVKTGLATKDVTGNAADARVTTALRNLSSKTKTALRLGFGGTWMASDMFGIRAKLEAVAPSKLKDKDGSLNAVGLSTKGFKNTFAGSVGVFVKF